MSVGEVQAAMPIITSLRDRRPDLGVALSVTTRTGIQVAAGMLSGREGVRGPYPFPLDLPWAVSRRFDELDPQALILIDTELWPNLISAAHGRNIPVFIANGRISDRSFPRYRAIRWWLRPMLETISIFWMQSDIDAERIIAIGAPARNVRVPGNLKIDAMALQLAGAATVNPAAGGSPRVLAASTHPGEEAMLLEAAALLRDRGRRFRLAIAPRHPERAAEVQRQIESAGFRVTLRSRLRQEVGGALWPDNGGVLDVLLIDTIGELTRFFPAAQVVFVGGSLVPKGGHNIFEPAAFGRPILYGPHMENFREADRALNGKGGRKVFSTDELGSVLESFLDNPQLAESMGCMARATFDSLKGAAARIVSELEGALPK